jgi:hypothetical protein
LQRYASGQCETAKTARKILRSFFQKSLLEVASRSTFAAALKAGPPDVSSGAKFSTGFLGWFCRLAIFAIRLKAGG